MITRGLWQAGARVCITARKAALHHLTGCRECNLRDGP
jgi:hypothetical protein